MRDRQLVARVHLQYLTIVRFLPLVLDVTISKYSDISRTHKYSDKYRDITGICK